MFILAILVMVVAVLILQEIQIKRDEKFDEMNNDWL